MKLARKQVMLICPNTWVGTGFKQVKKEIIDCGLSEIVHLDRASLFSDICMNLCYFVITKGYTGDISVTYSTGHSVTGKRYSVSLFDFKEPAIQKFIDMNCTGRTFKLIKNATRKASYYADSGSEQILSTITAKGEARYQCISLIPGSEYTIDTTDKGMWKIAFGEYRRGAIAIIPPGIIVPNTFYYLAYSTEKEATTMMEYFMSPIVRWVVDSTHSTRTFCGATLKYVPFVTAANTTLKVDDDIIAASKQIGDRVPY